MMARSIAFVFLYLSLSLLLVKGTALINLFQAALAPEIHCSRERSGLARTIIEEYLLPFVEKEDYIIPSKCRLHPDNDLYRDQERHKIHLDMNQWQCGYCKKSFYAEKHLHQHFDERHYDSLNSSHGKCLADLCGALHCDVISSKSRKIKCNPAAAARNRHFCESLASSCFPVNGGPSASRLHEFFIHQFCNSHTCTGGPKPFSKGKREHTSIFYLSMSILTMLLLPVFYLFFYLYQKGLSRSSQDLRRIPRHKKKAF